MVKVEQSTDRGQHDAYEEATAIELAAGGGLLVWRQAGDDYPVAIFGPGEWRKAYVVDQ